MNQSGMPCAHAWRIACLWRELGERIEHAEARCVVRVDQQRDGRHHARVGRERDDPVRFRRAFEQHDVGLLRHQRRLQRPRAAGTVVADAVVAHGHQATSMQAR
nr:hypothetical protein [Burkholderia ubonensis]